KLVLWEDVGDLGALLSLVGIRLGGYTHPETLKLGKRGEVKFTLGNLPAECFESRSEVPERVLLEGRGVPELLASVLFGFDNLEGPDEVRLAAFLPYLILNAVDLHQVFAIGDPYPAGTAVGLAEINYEGSALLTCFTPLCHLYILLS